MLNPLHVCHVIVSLERSGAQTMLSKLVSSVPTQHVRTTVLSLLDGGALAPEIESYGATVDSVAMSRRGFPSPRDLMRLRRLLRAASPDVVQTWMYHADLLGGMAARSAGLPVVWNIRHSRLLSSDSRRTKYTARACGKLSAVVPKKIVVNSASGLDAHTRLGYASHKMVQIPNGFDLDRFRPDPVARHQWRQQLQIANVDPVVGLVGRDHPDKDIPTWLSAARAVRLHEPNCQFILCGPRLTIENDELRRQIRRAKLDGCVHLLGEQRAVSEVLATMDVFMSSSATEGFPNVLGEAMACGVPCVATDVGESADIVGHVGRIVPPRNPRALAEACVSLLSRSVHRVQLGKTARARIADRYSLQAIVDRYVRLWCDVSGARAARPAA